MPQYIELPDRKWWRLSDFGGQPVVLDAETAGFKSFVYDRNVGLVPCDFGKHSHLMALLYAWRLGHDDFFDLAESLRVENWQLADLFIRLPGTAFRSSLHKHGTVAAARGSLADWEASLFRSIDWVEQ